MKQTKRKGDLKKHDNLTFMQKSTEQIKKNKNTLGVFSEWKEAGSRLIHMRSLSLSEQLCLIGLKRAE